LAEGASRRPNAERRWPGAVLTTEPRSCIASGCDAAD